MELLKSVGVIICLGRSYEVSLLHLYPHTSSVALSYNLHVFTMSHFGKTDDTPRQDSLAPVLLSGS